MSDNLLQPLDKLITLLIHVQRGAFAIALYDRRSCRREMIATLRQRLSQRVHEVTLSEQERNPIDLIRALKPKQGEVVCLLDLERAFPEALGYLDLQREILTDLGISLVCWVTPFEHRELAHRAPNFYAFRTAVFDFTSTGELPPAERLFIGRKHEVRELSKLLNAGGCVVLTGLGGVGKTALAREVVDMMRSHFSGGMVWVNCDLKPMLGDILLTAAVSLIGDVARQFRPDEQRQRLDDAMRAEACLLILDNFETIAEDGEVLRWLKTISAPSMALIVSRQSVPYLNAPTLRLAELSSPDAVELFAQRARDAGWEGADTEVVPRLCELVGNLPLAIELLATRAAELPLTVLAEMVNRNLDALATVKDSSRDERHQSIAACFRITFNRLSEDARTLLMRLSVVPDGLGEHLIGSFTGIEAWQQPIAECVRHSLLNLEAGRYRFHPLLRRFAFEQLGDAVPEWQRRFVAFFRQLTADNADINDVTKRTVFDAEWRNASAAAETAEELADWNALIALFANLTDFLDLRGMWSELQQLGQRSLAAARAAGDRFAQGLALIGIGNAHASQGQQAAAETAYQQSLAIWRELSNGFNEGRVLNNLGLLYGEEERWKDAEHAFQQSLALLRKVGDHGAEGATLDSLGTLYRQQGRWKEAGEAYRQSLAKLQKSGDRAREGIALMNLGMIYQQQRRWAKAEQCYHQSLAIFREFGDRVSEGQALENLALLQEARGDLAAALELGREAVAVLETTEDVRTLGEARELVAKWEGQAKPRRKRGKGKA